MDKLDKATDKITLTSSTVYDSASQKMYADAMPGQKSPAKPDLSGTAPAEPGHEVVQGKDGLPTVHIFDKTPTIEELRKIFKTQPKE